VSSASRSAQDALGDQWQALSDLWRGKQLQYTWIAPDSADVMPTSGK
ncbi:MAG: haloacid dehalogenase, partial [Propionivibrio sp.]|nr:haloacid dehalogenase [Propionivibrio sp.]